MVFASSIVCRACCLCRHDGPPCVGRVQAKYCTEEHQGNRCVAGWVLQVVQATFCMCRDSYGMEALLDLLGSPVTSLEKQVSVLNTLAHLARDLGNGNAMCRLACLLRCCSEPIKSSCGLLQADAHCPKQLSDTPQSCNVPWNFHCCSSFFQVHSRLLVQLNPEKPDVIYDMC